METLIRNVTENWGDDGRRWLSDLPALIDEVAADWDVRVGALYPMTFHWVAAAACADGTKAVLKLGVADGHLAPEAEALRVFDGQGAVRLLAENPARGALLVERADPGGPVPIGGEAALVEVGNRLHRVRETGFDLPHLRKLRGGFERYQDGPIPRRMVDRAAELFDDLCDSAPRETVLHGDLHHGNVLRGRDGEWLAIDPHGWFGDPGYDGGAMLYNPDPERRDPEILARVPERIDMLTAYEERERVVAWGYVMGVLSELWTVEASGQARSRALDVARMLEPQLD
ncbi:aminoglycoside phosphotransferase family protein [Actinoplanes bogorensis]|uniref:Aminoglycoside phosphotransferase family protein n=1 Tax=Paractinoplanes bogorensis TaxID=1610840 RepID=A0ABS5Z4G1_9ACTN|nr:aminoglycoside phosphotransferase family protein [Actinoplanes bogorensis]MBU2670572.1 aminoglycoside phosphotransferase family protein [Actinoplanes bogorensis]